MNNSTKTNLPILEELKQVMLGVKSETQIKKFVFENFEKFPLRFQQNLAASFLAEGLSRKLEKEIKRYQRNSRGFQEMYQATGKILNKNAKKPNK